MTELRKKTLKALKNIRLEGPGRFRRSVGICMNLRELLNGMGVAWVDQGWVRQYIRRFYPSWPHWSGDNVYPVPSPDPGQSPLDAYQADNVWVGEYGALRYSLLEHLIAEIEKDLRDASVPALD